MDQLWIVISGRKKEVGLSISTGVLQATVGGRLLVSAGCNRSEEPLLPQPKSEAAFHERKGNISVSDTFIIRAFCVTFVVDLTKLIFEKNLKPKLTKTKRNLQKGGPHFEEFCTEKPHV